jgi:hypothetical protein
MAYRDVTKCVHNFLVVEDVVRCDESPVELSKIRRELELDGGTQIPNLGRIKKVSIVKNLNTQYLLKLALRHYGTASLALRDKI